VSLVGRLIKALGDKYRIERRHDGMKVRYYISPLAAQALGIIGDERAVKPLIKALKDDNEYKSGALYFKQLSNYAADALGGIGEPAVEPLIEALGDENSDVRRYAAKALDKLGWKPETDELRGTYLISTAAWESLVEWGEPAVEPLIKALGDNGMIGVRRSVAEALGAIGDERAVEPLIETLRGKTGARGWWVHKALGAFGEPAVEPLIKALGDECDSIRSSAAEVLRAIGDTRAVEPLITALGDEHWRVQMCAAKALGVFGDVQAVESLIETLRDKEVFGENINTVRKYAVEALGKIGDGRAVEPLIETLRYEGSDVRRSAAEALGEIGDGRAVEPLIEALEDEGYGVAKAAKKALKKLGHEVK
jgi:HEAT repeat protein